MFSVEQKRYIYENSVKIKDQNKYIQIMALYSDYFKKAKRNSIKRYIEFIAILLIILYIVCIMWFTGLQSIREAMFKISAVFVGALLVYKFGKFFLDYIDDAPIVKEIEQNKCDLLCYTGVLNDISKSLNYGTSSSVNNYFMTVSGNKLQINRRSYRMLEDHKGKEISIYYFAELLQRQLYITDASIILVEQIEK